MLDLRIYRDTFGPSVPPEDLMAFPKPGQRWEVEWPRQNNDLHLSRDHRMLLEQEGQELLGRLDIARRLLRNKMDRGDTAHGVNEPVNGSIYSLAPVACVPETGWYLDAPEIE